MDADSCLERGGSWRERIWGLSDGCIQEGGGEGRVESCGGGRRKSEEQETGFYTGGLMAVFCEIVYSHSNLGYALAKTGYRSARHRQTPWQCIYPDRIF